MLAVHSVHRQHLQASHHRVTLVRLGPSPLEQCQDNGREPRRADTGQQRLYYRIHLGNASISTKFCSPLAGPILMCYNNATSDQL